MDRFLVIRRKKLYHAVPVQPGQALEAAEGLFDAAIAIKPYPYTYNSLDELVESMAPNADKNLVVYLAEEDMPPYTLLETELESHRAWIRFIIQDSKFYPDVPCPEIILALAEVLDVVIPAVKPKLNDLTEDTLQNVEDVDSQPNFKNILPVQSRALVQEMKESDLYSDPTTPGIQDSETDPTQGSPTETS